MSSRFKNGAPDVTGGTPPDATAVAEVQQYPPFVHQ
jgi:hypothetical protein